MANINRYSQLIEEIFRKCYKKGDRKVAFERDDIADAARKLKIDLPKNIGDIVYSFRYRTELPKYIRECAPANETWVIRPAGKAKYTFSLTTLSHIIPHKPFAETKIPDATPGIIAKYAFDDEQALLAKLRYNRLIDIFTGVTCYSLQNHLRTTVPDMGQIETDEIYVGIDQRGAQYVFPVQAKGGSDQMGIVQVEQDFAMCSHKFPQLICRPIAALSIDDNLIALFAFEENNNEVAPYDEKHYRLVPPEQMSDEDLANYRKRSPKIIC